MKLLKGDIIIIIIIERIIINIIKRGRKCKAGREQFTLHQSKDPSPTLLLF